MERRIDAFSARWRGSENPRCGTVGRLPQRGGDRATTRGRAGREETFGHGRWHGRETVLQPGGVRGARRPEPEQAGANARLVEAVYAELGRTSPAGVSYATFRAMIR